MKKGFISFVLILMLIPIFVSIKEIKLENERFFNEIKDICYTIERSGMIRFEIENNTDFIIEKTIRDGKTAKMKDSIVEEQTETALKNYFRELESEGKADFHLTDSFENKNYLLTNRSEIFSKSISEFFTVFSAESPAKSVTSFTYHGGLNKDKVIVGDIVVNGYRQGFVIPIYYKRVIE